MINEILSPFCRCCNIVTGFWLLVAGKKLNLFIQAVERNIHQKPATSDQ